MYIVNNSSVKLTRGGKPYLVMDLFDGEEHIRGIHWNWDDEELEVGTVVKLIRSTRETYNGNDQLVISQMSTVQDADTTQFLPQTQGDTEYMWQMLIDAVDAITDEALRARLREILDTNEEGFKYAPAAMKHHHAFVGGLLEHTVDVLHLCIMLIDLDLKDLDYDVMVASAILHDIGKIDTYKFDRGTIQMTEQGKLLGHIAIAMREYMQGMPRDVQHCVLAHHGRLEWGSPVLPQTTEAHVLHSADMLSSR